MVSFIIKNNIKSKMPRYFIAIAGSLLGLLFFAPKIVLASEACTNFITVGPDRYRVCLRTNILGSEASTQIRAVTVVQFNPGPSFPGFSDVGPPSTIGPPGTITGGTDFYIDGSNWFQSDGVDGGGPYAPPPAFMTPGPHSFRTTWSGSYGVTSLGNIETSDPFSISAISPPVLSFSPLKAVYGINDNVTVSWTTPPGTTNGFRIYVGGGAGAYASCVLPVGCPVFSNNITGQIGDAFTLGNGRFLEVRACDAFGCSANPSNRITFDVTASAGTVVYTVRQELAQPLTGAGLGVANVWIGTESWGPNGYISDSCPSSEYIRLNTGSLNPDTFQSLGSGSGYSGLFTCLKYRAKTTDPGIQEVAVVGDYGIGGRTCPAGLALHSFGVGGLANGAKIGTCVRYGTTNVIAEVMEGGGGPDLAHPCFSSYAPTSVFVSSLRDNGIRTCISQALPEPVCIDKPDSISAICGDNPLTAAVPDSGCQVSRYDNFTPATLVDGSVINYDSFPSPGILNRSGGSCPFIPPQAVAKVRFRVVNQSDTFLAAQAYVNDTKVTPAESYKTSSLEIEPGFNLVKTTDDGIFRTFSGVNFRAQDYYPSTPLQTVKVEPGTTNDYTFRLTRIPFDYDIFAPDVTVKRGSTVFYDFGGSITASLKLVPGRPAEKVTLSLSDLTSSFIRLNLVNLSNFLSPTSCTPDCGLVIVVDTTQNTPLGQYTATITGTPLSKQATFKIRVVDADGNYSLNVLKQGTGTGLVSSVPFGINCGSVCGYSFSASSIVTVTAYSGPNSHFSSWAGCDSISGSSGEKCVVTMNAARSVTATFDSGSVAISPPSPNYRLSVGVVGSGKVIALNPTGINCGETCAADFTSGTPVDLSAAPLGSNSVFQSWDGCDNPSGLNCRMIMNANKSVKAIFSLTSPPLAGYNRLTLGKKGNGVIYAHDLPAGTIIYGPDLPGEVKTYASASPNNVMTCGTTCVADIPTGSVVNMSAFAGAYAVFQNWEGCDNPSGADCSVTMNADKTVVGVFNSSGPPPGSSSVYRYKLTVNKTGSGKGVVGSSPAGISCNGTCTTASNDFTTAATVVATPDLNSNFNGWIGCDQAVGNNCNVAIWLTSGSIVPFGDQTVIPAPPVLSSIPFGSIYSTEDLIDTSWTQPDGATFFRVLIGGGAKDYAILCGVNPGCRVDNTGSKDRIGNVFSVGTGRFIEVRACNGVGCSGPSNRLTFDLLGTDTIGYERTITASFNSTALPPPTLYSLTAIKDGNGSINSPVGIDCGTTCSVNLASGSSAVLTAAPDAGYSFIGWDSCDSVNNFDCTVTMNSSRTVTAHFSVIPPPPPGYYNLIVEKQGTGTGLVTGPGGISCGTGTGCYASFSSGSVVTLTASPDVGSSYAGWNGCDSVNGATGACTITMNSSRTVTVIFSNVPPPPPGSYNLTVNKQGPGVVTGPGGISCGITCVAIFASGTSVVLTASPDFGAKFIGWTDCDSVNNFDCTVVMNSSRTVTAIFAPGGVPVPHWIEIHGDGP